MSTSSQSSLQYQTKSRKRKKPKNQNVYHCLNVKCADLINSEDEAIECDFCGQFIHLKCETKMSPKLYKDLNDFEDNPLVYLCDKCHTILLPKKPGGMVEAMLARVESMMKTHRSVADDIMDSLSSKIKELHNMVELHKSSAESLLTQSTSSNHCIKSTYDKMSHIYPNIELAIEKLQQCHNSFSEKGLALTETTGKLENMLTTHHQSMADTDSKINDLISTSNHLIFDSTDNTKNLAKLSSLFDDCKPNPPNTMNKLQPLTTYEFPPLTRRHISFDSDASFPKLDNTYRPRPAPRNLAGAKSVNYATLAKFLPSSINSRLIPAHRPQPSPELSLVVYNTDLNKTINEIMEMLTNECHMQKEEVTSADFIRTNNSKSRPIIVTCIDNKARWMFLKAINSLTSRESTKTFARPFMTPEALKEDRKLYTSLLDVRKNNTGRYFKIHKKKIYEIVDNELIEYAPDDTNTETVAQSSSTSLNSDSDSNNETLQKSNANEVNTEKVAQSSSNSQNIDSDSNGEKLQKPKDTSTETVTQSSSNSSNSDSDTNSETLHKSNDA